MATVSSNDYDFCGWATKSDVRCSDGRIIKKDAFAHCNGKIVPLVWSHQHKDVSNILGHALLENRPEGVYAYCKFNDTTKGIDAHKAVMHGDLKSLSIFANDIHQLGADVTHGNICEVSLVAVGANPAATIDTVVSHGEDLSEEGVIYFGESIICHSADGAPDTKKETVADVLATLTDKQRDVVTALVAHALDEGSTDFEHSYDSGDVLDGLDLDLDLSDPEDIIHSIKEENEMPYNVFDQSTLTTGDTISHEDMTAAISDMKRYGSMKESCIAHSITNIDYLFPDYKTIDTIPGFIKRDTSWVDGVLNGVHHTPFSRIKSIFANITADEARAKGYIKGKLKKEQVFTLLKRTTDPQTVYKKQKFDRDDLIDITSFDVVSWVKSEMRMMLNEELARAILIGDGRLSSAEDKIQESHVRPIFNDDDLYTIKVTVTTAEGASDIDKAKAFIVAAIRSRKDYKGSGAPILYTTEDMLTSMLLIEDTTGRTIYNDEAQLAKKLRVSAIVTVPVMEGAKGKNGGDLLGIIVNLSDYNVGADKGGAINMFDDFDIDYNQQKYLIETRISGALIKPYSAIAIETAKASSDPGTEDNT